MKAKNAIFTILVLLLYVYYIVKTNDTSGEELPHRHPQVTHLTCFDNGQKVLDKEGVFSHSTMDYTLWEWQENGAARSFQTVKKATLTVREEIPCLARVNNAPKPKTISPIPFTCYQNGIKIVDVITDNGATLRDGIIKDPGNAWISIAWRWTTEEGSFVLTSPQELTCH